MQSTDVASPSSDQPLIDLGSSVSFGNELTPTFLDSLEISSTAIVFLIALMSLVVLTYLAFLLSQLVFRHLHPKFPKFTWVTRYGLNFCLLVLVGNEFSGGKNGIGTSTAEPILWGMDKFDLLTTSTVFLNCILIVIITGTAIVPAVNWFSNLDWANNRLSSQTLSMLQDHTREISLGMCIALVLVVRFLFDIFI